MVRPAVAVKSFPPLDGSLYSGIRALLGRLGSTLSKVHAPFRRRQVARYRQGCPIGPAVDGTDRAASHYSTDWVAGHARRWFQANHPVLVACRMFALFARAAGADPDGVTDAYGDYVIAVITSLPGENEC
jgi:hypothetical protein